MLAGIYAKQSPGSAGLAKASQDAAQILVLLIKGADINTKNAEGDSPLLLAAMGNHISAILALLLKPTTSDNAEGVEADVNAQNNKGETALMWAAKSGNEQGVLLLLTRGANLAIKSKSGETANFWARRAGQRLGT